MGIVLLLELKTLAYIGPSPNERLNPGPSNWVTQEEIDLLPFWRSKFLYVPFFSIVLVTVTVVVFFSGGDKCFSRSICQGRIT